MSEGGARQVALLGRGALRGLRLSVSVSESPDLQRLGLVEMHFRLALGELARSVFVSGGQLSYGGHLDPDGYTVFLASELQRFGRRDRPFHSILAWPEHRRLAAVRLRAQISALGLYGDLTGLDPDGNKIDLLANRPEEAVPELDEAIVQQSLTALRRYLTVHSDGRILIGGKRTGFRGALPGVAEEVKFSLEANKPIYLAGGFGGVTADVVRVLGIDGGAWIPPDVDRSTQQDVRWKVGLDLLAELWRKRGSANLDNGLTDAENRTLAVSHRPSEIAALVSLGLGRRFAAKGRPHG